MQIVFINGSTRANGNDAVLLKAASQYAISQGREMEMIHVSKLDFIFLR